MEKREIEFTTRLTREDVAGLIEALIEGLKDGKLKIKKSGEELELDVPRVVDLEIEACIDDERAEFEIEVSWRTNRAENPDLPLPKADRNAPSQDGPEESPAREAASPAGKEKAAGKAKKTTAGKTAAKSKSPAKPGKAAASKPRKSAPATASKAKSKAAPAEKKDKE